MDARRRYDFWISNPAFDRETKAELSEIANNPSEIEDRFYRDLDFGTAGLRGVLGAGTNRINRYTVAMAAAGLATVIAGQGDSAVRSGVVISYDSRRKSKELAWVAAQVIASKGVTVRLFDGIRPVPVLSFAIRRVGASGGIMITASHNPAEYNGFKAYGEDGSQCPPETAADIATVMRSIQDPTSIDEGDFDALLASGVIRMIGSELDDAYMEMLHSLEINREAVLRNRDMKIVYTPLHGTGNVPVRRILSESGFRQILTVPEQEQPDPGFSTVKSPNPEERDALAMAIALAARESADLAIATDPDADRMGIAVRQKDGSYRLLTGNQIGILLMDYILSAKKAAGTLPEKSFCVTTIVSTRMARKIASHYGVELMECLTGFKFIGELILAHDENGNKHFQFGFEESHGYLSGTDVRDKDAVVAVMLAAEMAASARDRGLTLHDLTQELFERFGHAAEKTLSVALASKEGLERIHSLMKGLRDRKCDLFKELGLMRVKDYLTSTETDCGTGRETGLLLPVSNVLLYELDGMNWFCVRPSGTEPKIKIYAGAYGDNKADCEERLEQITTVVQGWMDGHI